MTSAAQQIEQLYLQAHAESVYGWQQAQLNLNMYGYIPTTVEYVLDTIIEDIVYNIWHKDTCQ